MKTYIISACLALFFISFSNAQVKGSEVLFTVGESPVYASEFLRVYHKNLDIIKDESQKDIDEYFKLFLNYKLKLAEAKELGYHKKPKYVRELNGYKKQLAKNYLTDHEVTEALVREAHDRVSHDVWAQHILVKMNPSKKDTLVTYNNLLKLREKLKNEDFATVQKELHDGNSVLVEDLGYFSGFKMVYDFESMAFNTKVGEVSLPFRTQFGFHIVKTVDKRKSRGEVTVAHIMVANRQNDSTIVPEERIQEINKLVTQGEDFESLAKQFSDDKSSSGKGGRLAAFKGGQLSSKEFEDVAFSLSNVDEVSKPFETAFGWHIVKLIEKKPVGSFEEMKYELETMVRKDSRSKLINTALQKRLRRQYNIKNDNPGRDYFISVLNEEFYKRKWMVPDDLDRSKTIFTVGDRNCTYGQFANFLKLQQKGTEKKKPFAAIVDDAFEVFVNKNVLAYHEGNLENENEEFANILTEYREGLLLFDLMENKIWNTVKFDTVGIQTYYDQNKQNYKQSKRIDAVVATASKEKHIKTASRLLKQGNTTKAIKEKLNSNGEQNVIFTKGEMTKEHQSLPQGFVFKEGVSGIFQHNNAYHVVKVNKILPETIKTLEEARGLVISDYQEMVEKKWLEELKNKHKVSINDEVLLKIKSEIKK